MARAGQGQANLSPRPWGQGCYVSVLPDVSLPVGALSGPAGWSDSPLASAHHQMPALLPAPPPFVTMEIYLQQQAPAQQLRHSLDNPEWGPWVYVQLCRCSL